MNSIVLWFKAAIATGRDDVYAHGVKGIFYKFTNILVFIGHYLSVCIYQMDLGAYCVKYAGIFTTDNTGSQN